MKKQNVVNGIFFSLKKEGDPVLGYDMDETWGHYVKWNKLMTKRKKKRQVSYGST